jgi:hypothetical protein
MSAGGGLIRWILLLLAVLAFGCSEGDKSTNPQPGSGSIWVKTAPGSASVSLDGTATHYAPIQFDGVAAGSHTLSITLLGYADTTSVVSVTTNGTAIDSVVLRPLAGTPKTVQPVWTALYSLPGPMAVGPTGLIYLTANVNTINTLLILSSAGALLHATAIPDQSGHPVRDIVVDSQGFAYVAPAGQGGYVYVFDSSGSLVRTLGEGQFGTEFPVFYGLAIGPGDTLHVATLDVTPMPIIEKYASHSAGAAFKYSFLTGYSNSGPIEVDQSGNIYLVAGFGTPQIVKMGRTGAITANWPTPAWVTSITRAPDGFLYTASPITEAEAISETFQAPGRIRKLSTSGTLQAEWAVENKSLEFVVRLGIDAAGDVYAPHYNDRRVLKFIP